MLEEIEREIFTTPAEFVRELHLAFPGGVEGEALEFQAHYLAASMRLRLIPGPERRIALVRLPSLHVRIRFDSGDAAARECMLRRMDLAMQRGGG